MGIRRSKDGAIYVASIVPKGAAERCGIEVGSI